MGKEETCEVCGGTESKLVDGFYYCVECGTQDTNVRETLVEHQMLEDGHFAIGRRTKYSVKMKEGVDMSPEWYKWHTYNFVLAGLTEQLIDLGAAPSLRIKVLWIWSRYIKMYQKKDEMGRFRVLSQLEERESASEAETEAEREALLGLFKKGRARVDRVSRQVLVAILALALNFDRSHLQLSHFTRFVTFRLLTVNDALRFVPPELLRKHKQHELGLQGTLFYCNDLPLVMGRLIKMLDLGAPRAPDVEALVESQLRELRLPHGLGRLVRALIQLLPVSWEPRAKNKDVPPFPDYETTVLAYIVVALKMCFGLDDDYEVRLSDAVDRINSARQYPRAFASEPEPSGRLFSLGAWRAQLGARARLLSRQHGPSAWRRNMRASDFALMEHFEEFTTAWAPRNKKTKPLLSDEVTMDIIGKIPRKCSVGVLPLAELRPAVAAREPGAALARLLAPRLPPEQGRLLDEDFTQYSVEYAVSRLALPAGDHAFKGVGLARKQLCEDIGQHLVSHEGDPTIVYVKDCENKNWAKTRRPTAAHVVAEGEEREPSDAPREEERELETFDEETEDRNIFDDDFYGIKIKEEKVEIFPDPSENLNDETKDSINFYQDFCDDLDSSRRDSAEGRSRVGGPFDSDEESGPQFDPRTFNRAETIKQIMIAAYKQYIGNESLIPVRFRTAHRAPKEKSGAKPRVEGDKRSKAWVRKREIVDGKAAIDSVVMAYQSSLATDAMHQVAEQVRNFVDFAAGQPDPDRSDPDPPDPARDASAADMDADPDESRDVQVIETDAKNDDDDSFDGPVYDPVYKGDAKFDEKTHDVSQLFLKVRPAPPAPVDAAHDLGSVLDGKTPDSDAALEEERKRKRNEKDQSKLRWRKKKENIDHLVDDPESITEFNYWCKHYKYFRSWVTSSVQAEMMDESFPRSFRFVLRESAAIVGVATSTLYQRVCDVERVMLSLLWRPRPRHRRAHKRKPGGSSTAERKTKRLKNTTKKYPKVSKKIRNNYTSDDTSDSEAVSDVARESQDESRSASVRRSGRLREKAGEDPFWQ